MTRETWHAARQQSRGYLCDSRHRHTLYRVRVSKLGINHRRGSSSSDRVSLGPCHRLDIGISDCGPVLIEGNKRWSPSLIQMLAPHNLRTGELKALCDSLEAEAHPGAH